MNPSSAAASELVEDVEQRYEYVEGTSSKFWCILYSGKSHTVTYGRIGTDGQTKTKEFPTEAKARASAEKLIAEKVKKGYVPTGDAAPKAATKVTPKKAATKKVVPKKAATKKAATKKAAAKKTAAKKASGKKAATKATKKNGQPVSEAEESASPVEVDSAAQIDVVTEVTHRIALEPEDWARNLGARNRQPVELPPPEPFDLASCAARVGQLKSENYGWSLRWCDLHLRPNMEAEEAHFWLWAMTRKRDYRKTARKLAKELKEGEYTGRVELKQAVKAIGDMASHIPPEIMIPLQRLFTVDELFGMLRNDLKVVNPRHHSLDEETLTKSELVDGFTDYVVPYLSDSTLEGFRKQLRKDWKPGQDPGDYYNAFPIDYYLAAAVGMHEEVLQVVMSLDDDRYDAEDWADHYHRPQSFVLGLGSSDRIIDHWQRLKLQFRDERQIRRFLAATESQALDLVANSVLRASDKDSAKELMEAFARVEDPAASELILQCKLESKAPAVARDWLDRFVGNGIAGLLEVAAGRGKLADAAVQYLRDLKQKGHGDLLQELAAQRPTEKLGRVKSDVLEYTPKHYEPFTDKSTPKWLSAALEQAADLKPKKLPAWSDPATLPTVAIDDAHCLNPDQVLVLLNTLKESPFPDGHPLLTELAAHGDAETLDAFAWRLFESWLEDGAPAKEKWAMQSIAYLGGDKSALKLTPMIRAWPGESQHQRAVLGLECLRGIGTDTALMQLNGISQKVKFQGIKKKAREYMEVIAKAKGMTRQELEDRVVPDLGLDERGSREFDFGPRKFFFVLSPDLKPAIRDEDKKVRKDLPKPAAKDDSAKAEAAVAEWKLLKKQLRETIKIQVPRLEQAMVTGRRWSPSEFEQLLVQHPLMINFVRLVLWGGYDAKGNLVTTFRVTDEQDYADASDEPTTLAKCESVGIVHPLHLEADTAAAWGEVFSDYEIAAPFPQLGREVLTLEKGEAKQKEITRFEGRKLPAISLVGTLDRLGWTRGIPEDAGVFYEHSKPFYGADVTAVVQYDGVPIGYIEGWEDQDVKTCFFLPGIYTPEMYPGHKKRMVLGKVDPIVISEVLSDLNAIMTKATN